MFDFEYGLIIYLAKNGIALLKFLIIFVARIIFIINNLLRI